MGKMTVGLSISLCFGLMMAVSSVQAGDLTGIVSVIDGDTIEMHGTRIRLHGIDAPEARQTCHKAGKDWRCGKDAAWALEGLVRGKTVACAQRDKDRYGRIVATCRIGRQDIGAWMVEQGWALAFRRYSSEYVVHEARARSGKRGMWAGSFEPPWEWRRTSR
jgi:endonuclease YncB( thermonuclease family)